MARLPPCALLLGAVSAVIRYNCLARSLAVIINRPSGIPALNYFGDFGALVPEPLGTMALWVVENTSLTLGAPMRKIKSLVDAQLTFLGLLGSLPGPQRGLILSIALPQDKITKWSQIIRDRIANGRTTSNHLGKLIGAFPFAETSVFGRFGRAILIPLRGKLEERPYSEILSAREIDILLWRGKAITSHAPRTVEIRHKFPEYVIYTDAATSNRITAALVFNNATPSEHPIIDELREEEPPPLGRTPFRAQHTFTGSKFSPLWGSSYS